LAIGVLAKIIHQADFIRIQIGGFVKEITPGHPQPPSPSIIELPVFPGVFPKSLYGQ
jgi:hypothetical protein